MRVRVTSTTIQVSYNNLMRNPTREDAYDCCILWFICAGNKNSSYLIGADLDMPTN